MKRFRLPSAALCLLCALAILPLLAGCGDAQKPPKAEAPAATAQTPADLLGPRYKATLAQGIDFSRDGFPEFLSAVEGLSLKENWGRWSDANLAPSVKLSFAAPLPRKLQVVLTATTLGENDRLPFAMRIGGVEKSFSVSSTGMRDIALEFELAADASQIEIVAPKPVSPKELGKSEDARRLGIGLAALRITERK